jgi:hypothetical protein
MGSIIYWGIVRFAIVLLFSWVIVDRVDDYSGWWTMFFVALVVVVIYPAQLSYRKLTYEAERASRNSLCGNCKHFAEEAVLCTVTDEHVTRDYTPCEGLQWEPKEIAGLPS